MTDSEGKFLADNFACFSEAPAVFLPAGRVISYARLEALIGALSVKLPQRRGLVFLLCSNELPVLVAYLACLRNKLPLMLLDSRVNPKALQALQQAYHPMITLVPDSETCLIRSHPTEVYPIHPDLALLLSTSGSTGAPKQVRLSYKNLQANAGSIASYLSLSADDRAITTLPFNYSYGLSVINSHLLVGASLILTNDSVMSKSFWEQFDSLNPTSMSGVPHTYELLDKLKICRRDLSSLRYMTQAGGRLDESLVVKFSKELACKEILFYVMYGQTEAAARMAYLSPEDTLAFPGSIGKAIPGGEFQLVDENGGVIKTAGSEGELVYIGDNVMMGYASSAEDLSYGAESRRLHTGDVAMFNETGHFYVCGRKDRTIKVLGHRLDLDDLQQRLVAAGWKVACAGKNDRLVVGVVSSNDAGGDKTAALKEELSRLLPFHMSVVSIVELSALPVTASGKIAYGELLSNDA
jgi:acyl-coenzyme A synthetase/AMP-(fatty) acid ligase